MSDVTVLSIDMIVSNPKIRSGRPIIAGTTLRVQDIAVGFVHKGYSVDELLTHYPHLDHAQILAALAYYYAHQDEIDRQIEADERLLAEVKQGIERLEAHYTFRDEANVRTFLEQHAHLVPILAEAARVIRRFFPSPTLILDRFADREDPAEEQAVIVIQAEMGTEAILEALAQFEEAWWFDTLERADDKLIITVGTL